MEFIDPSSIEPFGDVALINGLKSIGPLSISGYWDDVGSPPATMRLLLKEQRRYPRKIKKALQKLFTRRRMCLGDFARLSRVPWVYEGKD